MTTAERAGAPRREGGGFLALVARLALGPDGRLLGCCLAGALLLAVMTGPDGSSSEPTSGITGSLQWPRVFGFLIFGLVLWLVMTVVRKTRSGELTQVSARGSKLATAWRAIWDHWLKTPGTRWALGILSLAVTLVLALLVAVLTGPVGPNKVSESRPRPPVALQLHLRLPPPRHRAAGACARCASSSATGSARSGRPSVGRSTRHSSLSAASPAASCSPSRRTPGCTRSSSWSYLAVRCERRRSAASGRRTSVLVGCPHRRAPDASQRAASGADGRRGGPPDGSRRHSCACIMYVDDPVHRDRVAEVPRPVLAEQHHRADRHLRAARARPQRGRRLRRAARPRLRRVLRDRRVHRRRTSRGASRSSRPSC